MRRNDWRLVVNTNILRVLREQEGRETITCSIRDIAAATGQPPLVSKNEAYIALPTVELLLLRNNFLLDQSRRTNPCSFVHACFVRTGLVSVVGEVHIATFRKLDY